MGMYKTYLTRAKNYVVEVEMDYEKKNPKSPLLEKMKEVEEAIEELKSILNSEED